MLKDRKSQKAKLKNQLVASAAIHQQQQHKNWQVKK